MKEKIIEEKRIFTGRLLKLNADRVSLKDGTKTFREYVSHPGAVAALPFINESEIILVRQYRYPVNEVLLEIPAGTIEEGESPIQTIQRELQEEINYKPGKLEKIGDIYLTPGYSNEIIHLFKASDLIPCSLKRPSEEKIEIVKIKIEDVVKKINKGEIKDGKTIIAILAFISRTF
ncbi:MAG: NUDIX hydrolase [candidate division WOR-3 bacterium]